MTTFTILSGTFAQVFAGNGNYDWLVEGDDIQQRANANINPYWMTPGRDCPIAQRNVEGHALVADGRVVVLYKTREHAERALADIEAGRF